MIDASHDNSGKDPDRQVLAARRDRRAGRGGQRAIVGRHAGVVPRRRAPGPRDAGELDLRPVDHRRLPRLGADGRRSSTGSPARSSEARRGRMRIAVLGVGLIGGSIGLAARRRLGAEVAGFDPDSRERSSARSSSARSTPRRARWPRRVDGRRAGLLRRPRRAPCPTSSPRRSPRAAPTPWSPTSARPSASSSRASRRPTGRSASSAATRSPERRPPASRTRAPDLFEGARWYLTPTDRSSGILYDRLQRAVAGPRRPAAGDRAPRPTTA